MYHKVILAGYLGRDPEMRYTQDGTPVTNFSVAVNRNYTRDDGTKVEQTVWFRISAWRRMAEVCNEYLQKGRAVLIEGTLRGDENGNPRIWTGNDDEPRASFEINASTVKFLPSGNGGGSAGGGPEASPSDEPDDEPLPF